MAASLNGVFADTLQEKITKSKILVVGAGGIGCEILKNLVLCGFPTIEIVDLDTIDLSNLNRQFLFHREHVGKSKAQVARESALKFNPDVNITAHHDSILATEYGVNYFKQFDLVLNALDNRAARNHVNRMCLNADVVLIESGTAGYDGQVEVIKRGLTQCYECTPKARQKTFPGCTIRNTPSEPIHCIVWAKHLFNQLFGESIEDEDISPDMADPEAQNEGEKEDAENPETEKKNGEGDVVNNNNVASKDTGNVARINTRQWAKDMKYDAKALFQKFFYDDINYLLKMSNLWKTRKAPTPLNWDSVLLEEASEIQSTKLDYHKIWSAAECARVFEDCLKKLKTRCENQTEDDSLVWDKDDQPAMDFVAACANIRSLIYQIPRKSRFEIKSMAGNIIPAIATTNAIIAGVVVMHAFKVLQDKVDECKAVYARLRQNPRQQIIVPEKCIVPPNPDCYVCAADPAVHIRIDTNKMTVKDFRDDVLIKTLNMVNPDVTLSAKGVIVISSEEGETEMNEGKLLKDMEITDGVILECDDFFQNYKLNVIILHIDPEHDEPLFEVIADKNQLKPKEEDAKDNKTEGGSEASDDGPSTSKKMRIQSVNEDDDDDLCLIEDDEDIEKPKDIKEGDENMAEQTAKKLNVTTPQKPAPPVTSQKLDDNDDDDDDDEDDDVVEEITEVLDSSEEEDEDFDDECDDEDYDSEDNQHNTKGVKRKAATTNVDENEITEILDSSEEEEQERLLGPTKQKRARREGEASNNGEVINID